MVSGSFEVAIIPMDWLSCGIEHVESLLVLADCPKAGRQVAGDLAYANQAVLFFIPYDGRRFQVGPLNEDGAF